MKAAVQAISLAPVPDLISDSSKYLRLSSWVSMTERRLVFEIERLKACHRIQVPELKSASVIKKPELIIELLEYLDRDWLPLIIEVVDKRFMTAANMVNTVILPYQACDFSLCRP